MLTEGNYTYCGENLAMYIILGSLCCTPEANIKLYINYISLKKNQKDSKIDHRVRYIIIQTDTKK